MRTDKEYQDEYIRKMKIIIKQNEEDDERNSKIYGEDDGVYKFKVTTTNSSQRSEIVTIME